MLYAGVPPIEGGERVSGPGCTQGVPGFRTALAGGRNLVVEALPDLIDSNDVFPTGRADVDTEGTDELEVRATRHYSVAIGTESQTALKTRSGAGVPVSLEKSGEASTDLHAGQNAARVHMERTHVADAVLHRRFALSRIELGAERNVTLPATGPHDHRPTSADVDDFPGLFDIAVAPVAL